MVAVLATAAFCLHLTGAKCCRPDIQASLPDKRRSQAKKETRAVFPAGGWDNRNARGGRIIGDVQIIGVAGEHYIVFFGPLQQAIK